MLDYNYKYNYSLHGLKDCSMQRVQLQRTKVARPRKRPSN